MSTKKIQIIGGLGNSDGGDADTLDGKHASDFAAFDHEHSDYALKSDVDDCVTQIENAVANKSQVQIITWEVDD